MKALANVALIKAERKPPGRPKKVFNLRKLAGVKDAKLESLEQALENLLILDARCLDADTARKLVDLLPRLRLDRAAWKARFADGGCLSCHRKKVDYASGGLCGRCAARELWHHRQWRRRLVESRGDPAEVIGAMTRRLDAAQALFNGDEQ